MNLAPFILVDNSMNIGAKLEEKTAIIQMELTPDEMIAANPKTIKAVDEKIGGADSFFLVHCGGRRLGLQLEAKEEGIYPAVKEVTGDREFLMVFTGYGPAGHEGGCGQGGRIRKSGPEDLEGCTGLREGRDHVPLYRTRGRK